jgi:type IV pilus assembly protein PilB
VSEAQLEEALRAQPELPQHVPVGQILVDRGLITQRQLDFVLDKYRKRPRLGDLLVRTGRLAEAQLDAALEHQRSSGLRLGDALLELGLVSEEELKQALCTQLNVPYLDLDRVAIHRGLTKLVNKRYAETHHVVPIAEIGNSITVAIDDPTDDAIVAELAASTGSRINVVTSTRASLQRAFARAYQDDRREDRAETAVPADGADPGPLLQDLREAHERLRREHEELRLAYRTLTRQHAEQDRALRELGERHATLGRERQLIADVIEALLRRLKP